MCLADPIWTGGIHKRHFTRLQTVCVCVCLCMCEKLNVTTCVSLHPPRGMYMVGFNVYVCDSSCGNLRAYFNINLCSYLCIFFSFLPVSMRVMWFVLECVCVCVCVCPPMLPSLFGLYGPVLSRIIAFEDMRHEFLIHCIFQLSHRGSDPAEGKKLFQGLCVCVCVCGTLSGPLLRQQM